MKFNIHGQKLEVTDAIRSYIKEKIGRLEKYFENPSDLTANVVIKMRGRDQVVEVTIPAPKIILRGEEANNDLYASIDLVSENGITQKEKEHPVFELRLLGMYAQDAIKALEHQIDLCTFYSNYRYIQKSCQVPYTSLRY